MTSFKALVLSSMLLAVPSLAGATKQPPPAQNHQCMKDGVVLKKTHKECLKEGGTWEKLAEKPADTKPAADAKPMGDTKVDAKPAPEPKPADKKDAGK